MQAVLTSVLATMMLVSKCSFVHNVASRKLSEDGATLLGRLGSCRDLGEETGMRHPAKSPL